MLDNDIEKDLFSSPCAWTRENSLFSKSIRRVNCFKIYCLPYLKDWWLYW